MKNDGRRTAALHALGVTTTLFLAPLADAQTPGGKTWGCLDQTRMFDPTKVLSTGINMEPFRDIITAQGGTFATSTDELTAAYLSGIDIFFAGQLQPTDEFDNVDGILSAAEQNALDDWLAAGGTLIVTHEILDPAPADSFTGPYGIFDDGQIANNASTTNAVHPIIAGVDDYTSAGQVTFTHGSNALVLAKQSGKTTMAVLESSTGFEQGGRILVLGDPQTFETPQLLATDTTVLAENLVAWAHDPSCHYPSAQHSDPALSIGMSTNVQPSANTIYGWEFVADADFDITHLGLQDAGAPGFQDAHDVGLYDTADQALLGSVSLESGQTGTLIDGFRYLRLAEPVQVEAGQRLIVAYHSELAASDPLAVSLFPPSFDADVTYVQSWQDSGTELAYPAGSSLSTVRSGPSFLKRAPVWFDLGNGKAGSTTPRLYGVGSLEPCTPASWEVTDVPVSTLLWIVIGFGTVNVPFKQGVLVPTPDLIRPWATSPSGTASLAFIWPAGVPSGASMYLQMWAVDHAASQSLSATNGLQMTTP